MRLRSRSPLGHIFGVTVCTSSLTEMRVLILLGSLAGVHGGCLDWCHYNWEDNCKRGIMCDECGVCIPFFIEKGKLCIVMHKYMCDGHAYVMQVCDSTLSRKEQITKIINLHRKFQKILQVMRLNQILCVDIKAQNTLLNYDYVWKELK